MKADVGASWWCFPPFRLLLSALRSGSPRARLSEERLDLDLELERTENR